MTTRGPRRLKDDPDFKWETGCDLADEEMLVGDYDLAGMKQSILGKIGADVPVGDGVPAVRPGGSSAAAAAAKPLVGMLVAAVAVVGAYWLGTQQGAPEAPPDERVEVVQPMVTPTANGAEAPPTPPPAPTEAPSVVVPVPTVEPAPSGPAAPPVEVTDEEPVDAPAEVPSAAAAEPAEASEVEADAPLAESPSGVPDEAEEAPTTAVGPPSSDAQRALALYSEAQEHLLGGDAAAARAGFEAYLEAFPDRYMWAEARLGLLQSLFALGDTEGTAALAEDLQDVPALSAKRAEILLLRAESLVVLERCDEALGLLDALPARETSNLRRACRQQRRSD